jgi:hypothetical protein
MSAAASKPMPYGDMRDDGERDTESTDKTYSAAEQRE